MALVYGFGGMRDYGGQLSFAPRIPPQFKRLRFRLTVGGQRLIVEMTHDQATYHLVEGMGLTLTHEGKELKLRSGETVSEPIKATVNSEGIQDIEKA